MAWDNRLAWAGEFPAGDAELLQRFDNVGTTGTTRTAVDATGRDWTVRGFANTAAITDGRWGKHLVFNENNPASERTSLTVPFYEGMWPSSGKLLVGAWASLRYSMGFTPIISTRNTAGEAPLVYLSTMSDGRPRAQVYSAAGSLVLDQSETLPWSTVIGEWLWFGQLIDLDARTSQIAVVRHTLAEAHLAPVRSFTGEPNKACQADFEALTLAPTASYWANGRVDEVGMWHLDAEFDFEEHVEAIRRACWAGGTGGASEDLGTNLVVTDEQVTATGNAVLHTGAEYVEWPSEPQATPREPLGNPPLALLSSDNGATWTDPAPIEELPAEFAGLLRWQIPLAPGETFTGIDLTIRPPVPELDEIADVDLTQHSAATIDVTGNWTGTPRLEVISSPGVATTIDGTQLTIASGLSVGEFFVVLVVHDDTGQTSDPIRIRVDVSVLPWEPGDHPVFARAPLIVHNAQGIREAVIDDPVSAVVAREVNGEETLTFKLPIGHEKAHLLEPEIAVEAAEEKYRIRRIKHTRENGLPVLEVYAEAAWYDLRVAGRVREREWSGSQAGPELEYVLDGTDWTVGAVNVTTRRTWTMEGQTTLAALRAVQEVHGGDLLFDTAARTVSLVAHSGRDRGVAFFHGHGLTDATRLVDTTNLLTRLEPRNEEGIGIESVNNGIAWLDDFTFSNEVRHGVYNFASGTSPQTMLAMATAAIGARARPTVSYEATVVDLSAWSGQDVDRFDVGDRILIVDEELGINSVQRIVALEYDLLQPWNSKVTLSEKLRELGGTTSAIEAGVLDTGASIDTRDLVPFNLLQNARFDNGLAHWAASGATLADQGVTGPRSVRFAGPGARWIEQTVAPDNRDAYTLSMQVEHQGPSGWVPNLQAIAEITYTDGTTETITLELS